LFIVYRHSEYRRSRNEESHLLHHRHSEERQQRRISSIAVILTPILSGEESRRITIDPSLRSGWHCQLH